VESRNAGELDLSDLEGQAGRANADRAYQARLDVDLDEAAWSHIKLCLVMPSLHTIHASLIDPPNPLEIGHSLLLLDIEST